MKIMFIVCLLACMVAIINTKSYLVEMDEDVENVGFEERKQGAKKGSKPSNVEMESKRGIGADYFRWWFGWLG
jgi:hypothetical protein